MTFKRQLATILIMLLMVTTFSPAYANKFSEYNEVLLTNGTTGKTDAFIPVGVTIGGEDVIGDVPAILYNEWKNNEQKTRTLVPIRVITETLGAKVTWDDKTKTAHIIYEDKDIALTVENPIAVVNGEEVELPNDIPAKIFSYEGNDRMLVPIRFVSEQLGLNVSWDPATRMVKLNRKLQRIESIEYSDDNGTQGIRIKSTGKVEHSDYFIDGATIGRDSKLVMRIPNTVIAEDEIKTNSEGTYSYNIGVDGIKDIVATQDVDGEVPETVFTITLSKNRGYEIIDSENEVFIKFINNIYNVGTVELFDREYIGIQMTQTPDYKVTEWEDKYIVDIMNAKLDDKYIHQDNRFNIKDDRVDFINFAQLDAKPIYGTDNWVTRVVINLKDAKDMKDIVLEVDNQTLFLSLVPDKTDKPKPSKPDDNQGEHGDAKIPLNDNLSYLKTSDDSYTLNLRGSRTNKYDLSLNKETGAAEIRIDKSYIKLNTGELKTGDAATKKIVISEKGSEYLIEVYLNDKAEFRRVNNVDGVYSVIFTNKNKAPNNNSNRPKYSGERPLIVIDPGHGGRDPGAISPIDGTEEKDVVLEISLRLAKKLEANGFDVYLTRTYDTYVDLYARGAIANELGADAFISIHANAMPGDNNTANGIETFYGSYKDYAANLHNGMMAEVDMTDRGIKQWMALVVIKSTNMPAVLVETGFLTNPNDLAKLKNKEYHEAVCEGLTKGLKKHFEMD